MAGLRYAVRSAWINADSSGINSAGASAGAFKPRKLIIGVYILKPQILLSETNLLQPLGRRVFVVVLLACRVVEVPHLEIRRVLVALHNFPPQGSMTS
jgi:hypothetical protein